ncbi:MAG: hypothetical protein HJJLKODD_02180 [Phycisphaerae bacterium]|nr:hypothetical protein [Phycisphaerae bacterium]
MNTLKSIKGLVCILLAIFLTGAFWAERPNCSTGNDSVNVSAPVVAQQLPLLIIEKPQIDLRSSDPIQFLQQCRAYYASTVRDYQCTFTKQELLPAGLSLQQVSEIKFRENPFSVFMHITQNPDRARRVLYVKGRHVDGGMEYAVVQPEGPIARLLVKSVLRPIYGAEAEEASRRAIDEFGFGRSLDLILQYAELATSQGYPAMSYQGEGQLNGRPTFVFHRVLPYTGPESPWPDALLIIHLDQELFLPIACFAYADLQKEQLLGIYQYTNIQLNIGLTERDFDPLTYGL